MNKLYVLLIFILVACSNAISATEAEDIALQAASDAGYQNPRLFTEYDTKTTESFHYSKKEDEDVKVWEVYLVTDERPREEGLMQDLVYIIAVEDGDIVDVISGVD